MVIGNEGISPKYRQIEDSESDQDLGERTKNKDLQDLKDLAEENGIHTGVILAIESHGKIVEVRVGKMYFGKGSRCEIRKIGKGGKEIGAMREIGFTDLIAKVNKVKMDKIREIVERQKSEITE